MNMSNLLLNRSGTRHKAEAISKTEFTFNNVKSLFKILFSKVKLMIYLTGRIAIHKLINKIGQSSMGRIFDTKIKNQNLTNS